MTNDVNDGNFLYDTSLWFQPTPSLFSRLLYESNIT